MKLKKDIQELFLFMSLSSLFYFLFTYRSFYSYFYFDDFDTLSWISATKLLDFIPDTFDFNYFASEYFYRPFGSLVHGILFKLFGLNFLPYYIVATFLHLFNLCCIYLLIRKLIPDRSSVFLGTFLFIFHVTAMPIYWWFFGTFDSLCASLLLLCFLFYIKRSSAFNIWFLLSVFCFLLAMRCKEMAFSFPLILTLYEILIPDVIESKNRFIKQILRAVWPFYALSLLAGLLKLFASIEVRSTTAYAVQFNLGSLIEGLRYFLVSALQYPRLSAPAAVLLFVFLGALPIIFRSKRLAFAYSFILIALLPILPLANRRADYNQYIPLIGVSIYSAELFRCLKNKLAQNRRVALFAFYLTVGLFCAFHSFRSWNIKKSVEESYLQIAKENREFVQLVTTLRPARGALFLCDSAPSLLFNDHGVFAVINLVFHDWTATVKFIPDCREYIPLEKNMCCISFKNRTVHCAP